VEPATPHAATKDSLSASFGTFPATIGDAVSDASAARKGGSKAYSQMRREASYDPNEDHTHAAMAEGSGCGESESKSEDVIQVAELEALSSETSAGKEPASTVPPTQQTQAIAAVSASHPGYSTLDAYAAAAAVGDHSLAGIIQALHADGNSAAVCHFPFPFLISCLFLSCAVLSKKIFDRGLVSRLFISCS
jgi:hypothetical protein